MAPFMKPLLCVSLALTMASSLVACTDSDPPYSNAAAGAGKDGGGEAEGGKPSTPTDVDAGTLPDGGPLPTSEKPANAGEVAIESYDGKADDLLTAGLGKSGLATATAPGY